MFRLIFCTAFARAIPRLGTGLRGAVALLFSRRRVHDIVVTFGGRLAGQRRQLVVRMPMAYDGRFARFDELGRAEARHRILGLGGGR